MTLRLGDGVTRTSAQGNQVVRPRPSMGRETLESGASAGYAVGVSACRITGTRRWPVRRRGDHREAGDGPLALAFNHDDPGCRGGDFGGFWCVQGRRRGAVGDRRRPEPCGRDTDLSDHRHGDCLPNAHRIGNAFGDGYGFRLRDGHADDLRHHRPTVAQRDRDGNSIGVAAPHAGTVRGGRGWIWIGRSRRGRSTRADRHAVPAVRRAYPGTDQDATGARDERAAADGGGAADRRARYGATTSGDGTTSAGPNKRPAANDVTMKSPRPVRRRLRGRRCPCRPGY
jgi:hypothetical protein